LGASNTPETALPKIPGTAMRRRADVFREEGEKNGVFPRPLPRYVQPLFVQLAQHTACNRLHHIEQRCARWLLMTRDQVGANTYPLTKEFLGEMLGVSLEPVNEVTRVLQESGVLRYENGIITILDADRLEAMSCECYRIIREEYDRMLGESNYQSNR